MGKELKVLMMGGARVGKSSALAAVMESFIFGKVSSILTAEDKTSHQVKNGERQATIKEKLSDVKSMLKNNNGKTILVNSGKTTTYWDYKLKLNIPGSTDTMSIIFTDVNGEYFEECGLESQKIKGLVKDYDVFIIAIDTPYMMEARNNDLVNSIINSKYNCIESIHTLLTYIDDSDGKDAKLVIFTPIKCEKWAQNETLDNVTKSVQEDYKTSLIALEKYKSVQIEIIPIQTIGSIVFHEHAEAFIFKYIKRRFIFSKKEYTSKCALLSDNKVRLSDGKLLDSNSGKLELDMDAVLIPGTDIMRPNTWFKVQSAEYKPHNCEQLAFHILDFMLSKVIDAKISKEENENIFIAGIRGIFNFALNVFTLGLWSKLKDIFGSISIEKMAAIITKMNNMNLIKREGEGIVILKKCNFKKV